MSKYEVYINGLKNPLKVEADSWEIDFTQRKLLFKRGTKKIAIFNFDKINGFMEVEYVK